MKQGDSFDCPHCGQNTFLKKESVMDGWTKVGEVLKCASCSALIEEIKPEDAPPKDRKEVSKSALLDLLGETEAEKTNLEFLNEDTRFCRDCAHAVANAFRLYCSKWDKDVNPMNDCPSYTPKKNKTMEGLS